MLRNYLKIALRNLRKRKGYTFINVVGLAVGMSCGLLLFLFVRLELSYDRFHDEVDRIYRVATTATLGEQVTELAFTSAPLAAAMEEGLSEVETTARVHWMNDIMRYGETRDYEDVTFVDSTFLEMFTFPLVRGNPATALDAPNTVVVTREVATRYFGDADPIGQTLVFADDLELRVTGLLDDIPPNSHIEFDVLASLSTIPQARMTMWGRLNVWTYVLLREGTSPKVVDQKLDQLGKERAGDWAHFYLQPLTDIYFESDLLMEIGPTGNRTYAYVFSAIGLFVLLVACINFMNLATARAGERAKEVGMRKVLGAYRSRLVVQFLSESVLLSLAALLLALLLAELALPAFREITEQDLSGNVLLDSGILLVMLGVALVVGLAAGSYPAFVLSAFQPVRVLKGTTRTSRSGHWIRQGLVVLQFGISIALLVGTAVIYQQLQFMQNKRLGFDREQVVVHRLDRDVAPQYAVLKERLLQHPDVLMVTGSNAPPGTPTAPDGFVVEGIDGGNLLTNTLRVDYNFIDAMGMELLAGRTFSRDFATDAEQAFIVNEAALPHFGWSSPEDAVGQPLRRAGDDQPPGQVIGVVKDFHYAPMRDAIEPLVVQVGEQFNVASLRIRGDRVMDTMDAVEATWTALFPDFPFQPEFLDEQLQRFYTEERRMGTLLAYFAGLAIVIACLGLFGLAAFTAEQRTKEIGIRKVLGASVPQIAVLLSKDYVALTLVANVIAWPVVYVAMERWLDHFAYHIAMPWEVFLLAGLAALLVALLTVSYQSIKAALADPVESLQYE